MNTADYIIKKLEEIGVNEFFGFPGDYNVDIINAVQNNSKTRWIGCTSALNAGYAADGYARIRGFGALVTNFGTGELSAINAIAGCYAENIPVVNIVGLPSTYEIDKKSVLHYIFQDADYKTFFRTYENVTAAAAFLTRDNAKIEIDRVFKTLVKERMPVYIALPSDIAKMEISDRNVDTDWNSDNSTLAEVTEKIIDKINDSQRPVILGDVLVKRFDSKIELKEFVAKSQIPMTHFLMGANLIDSNYEQYLGGYYGNLRNETAAKYICETDCLISIGVIYNDLNAFGLNFPIKINDHIAIYGNYCFVEGKRYDNVKMSDVLEHLTKLIEPKVIKINKPQIGYEHKALENKSINCEYIYPRLQEFIKENDIIIAESGPVSHGITQMKFKNNVDFQSQALWSSIGWATPAAFGACLAKPKSRVILVTGDGAHQITALEIGNMLRFGFKPVVITVNNQGYGAERFLCQNSKANFNDIVQMNFSKFARVFEGDIWATKVSTDEDLDKALKVTQIMNKMCYIEICTDKTDLPEITKKIINSVNSIKLPEVQSDNQPDDININDYVESSASLQYETIVHQGFNKSELNQDKDEEVKE